MSKTYRKAPKTQKVYQDKDRRHGVLHPSRQCLHHGGCPYCEGNRMFNWIKRKFWALQDILDGVDDDNTSIS
jgi:hypothetical protein